MVQMRLCLKFFISIWVFVKHCWSYWFSLSFSFLHGTMEMPPVPNSWWVLWFNMCNSYVKATFFLCLPSIEILKFKTQIILITGSFWPPVLGFIWASKLNENGYLFAYTYKQTLPLILKCVFSNFSKLLRFFGCCFVFRFFFLFVCLPSCSKWHLHQRWNDLHLKWVLQKNQHSPSGTVLNSLLWWILES